MHKRAVHPRGTGGRARLNLEEFYADEKRRASGEVPLAEGWRSSDDPDATFNLFWSLEASEVCALRIGPVAMGSGLPKPYLVDLPKMVTVGDGDQEISILGSCAELRHVMELVESAPDKTIEWMRRALGKPG